MSLQTEPRVVHVRMRWKAALEMGGDKGVAEKWDCERAELTR